MLPGLCFIEDIRWLVEFAFMGERIELAYVVTPGGVAIVDWNLTDDAGARAPLSVTVLDALPASLVCAMARAIGDDMKVRIR